MIRRTAAYVASFIENGRRHFLTGSLTPTFDVLEAKLYASETAARFVADLVANGTGEVLPATIDLEYAPSARFPGGRR